MANFTSSKPCRIIMLVELSVKDDNTFVEVQEFRQRWIWLMVIGVSALLIALFGFGIFTQLVKNQPWGDKPMSDAALVVTSVITIVFSVGLPFLIRYARLEVKVGPEALEINFRPFATRRISYKDILSVETKTYRPIWDYGGYGVRWAPGRGIAYNVSGNRGVLLRLSDGKRILIGSGQPEALADAIRKKGGLSQDSAGWSSAS